MLSIIISSYNQIFFNKIKNNINSTIGNGFIYELIKIDNKGMYSLCEAYNIGGQKAKYDNLLFLHEDVSFETSNWGTILINLLELKNCGIIGVLGGNYYGFMPSYWWNKGYKFFHYIQINKGKEKFYNRINFLKDNEEVKALDGVFLACKKKVFLENKFDERIKGYHGYDLIFSLQISKKYQNYVTSEILIKHFSAGNLNKEWFDSVLQVRNIIGFENNKKIDKQLELENFYLLIYYLKKFKYSFYESLKICFKYFSLNKFGYINSIKMLLRLRYLK